MDEKKEIEKNNIPYRDYCNYHLGCRLLGILGDSSHHNGNGIDNYRFHPDFYWGHSRR